MKRRWWSRPLLLLAWFYVLVEFITYDVLQMVVLRFAHYLPLRSFEAWARRQSARVALALLFLPALFLLPLKFLEVWLFLKHHFVSGILALVGAKLVGTALVAYLFSLTRPALLTMPPFARFYVWVMAWRQRVLSPLLQSQAYHAVQAQRRRLLERWSAWRTTGRRPWWRRVVGRLRYSRRTA